VREEKVENKVTISINSFISYYPEMDVFIPDQSHMAYTDQSLNTTAVYLEDFRSEPCQVCGENASGWHCGSITW
jgi:hypothetical protein